MSGLGGIRGVLFDKDGTLLDFDATWSAIGEAAALEAAGGDKARAAELLTRAGYDHASRRFIADSVFAAGTNAEIVALWYPGLDAAGQRETLARFDRYSVEYGSSRPVALPGIKAALADLHGADLRLAVATNDSTGGAEASLAALGIAQFFDAVYGYDAVANPKPAPDIVRAYSDFTGIRASELAMVGDNRHDLEMGRAGDCGLVVAVLSGTGTRESLAPMADVVLDSIVDLPAYLRSRPR